MTDDVISWHCFHCSCYTGRARKPDGFFIWNNVSRQSENI